MFLRNRQELFLNRNGGPRTNSFLVSLVSVREVVESDESFVIQGWRFEEEPPMWTSENRPKYNRDKLRYPSDLTDDEWSHIEPLIPPAKRGGRKRAVDPREIVNGVMYVLSTGCQWRLDGSGLSSMIGRRANRPHCDGAAPLTENFSFTPDFNLEFAISDIDRAFCDAACEAVISGSKCFQKTSSIVTDLHALLAGGEEKGGEEGSANGHHVLTSSWLYSGWTTLPLYRAAQVEILNQPRRMTHRRCR